MCDYQEIDSVLLPFPPCLRRNIAELWADGKVGLSSMDMKITPFSKPLAIDNETIYTDRLKLEIPYGGKFMPWEVSFCEEDYAFAPDFEFLNDKFLCDPETEIISTKIPSLLKWNITNPKAFISVIRELMALYKSYQVKQLQSENKFTSLYMDYAALTTSAGWSEDDVEVYIENDNAVSFLISINVNFSCLPNFLQPVSAGKLLNPKEDVALLCISFKSGRLHSSLQLSPRLEQVIGNSTTLIIPNFNKSSNLAEYVPTIAKLLMDNVEQIATNYEKKQEYISALLTLHGANIVEYDSIQYSKATVLLEMHKVLVLVVIRLDKKFPHEKPEVTLRSNFHIHFGKPVTNTLDHYPYSPRWEPEEMINRLVLHLNETFISFQNHCQKVAQHS